MADSNKFTFAVIDDDNMLRTLIQGILRDEGMELVASAATGEQGLKDCIERQPDLVVLDINLPGTDGLKLLATLKRGMRPPKVIMISSDSTAPNVKAALAFGADGFIVKPFNAGKLVKAVEVALLG